MGRKEFLEWCKVALLNGFRMETYSPGDGVTRYRIVKGEGGYFGGQAICTAIGLKEAKMMADAFREGFFAGQFAGTEVK